MRILTMNVQNLEGDPRRQELPNAELRRLSPDLVALQEVVLSDERRQLDELLAGTGLEGTHQSDHRPAVARRPERLLPGRVGAGGRRPRLHVDGQQSRRRRSHRPARRSTHERPHRLRPRRLRARPPGSALPRRARTPRPRPRRGRSLGERPLRRPGRRRGRQRRGDAAGTDRTLTRRRAARAGPRRCVLLRHVPPAAGYSAWSAVAVPIFAAQAAGASAPRVAMTTPASASATSSGRV